MDDSKSRAMFVYDVSQYSWLFCLHVSYLYDTVGRYTSQAWQFAGDMDKFPYTEPSQPPIVTSGKLSGVPNVVGGRGTAQNQVDSGKVQMTKPKGLRLQGSREGEDSLSSLSIFAKS